MDLSIVQHGSKELGRFLLRNSPTILTVLAVGGVVTTFGMTIKATTLAVKTVEEEEYLNRKDALTSNFPPHKITKMEVVKLTWKLYAPAAITGLFTIACVVGANSINLRQKAALASLYALSENFLKNYQEKVVEVLGKNKEEKLRDGISQDRLDRDPVGDKTIIITGNGETLCYDSLSARYFKSDIEKIRKAQNDFNELLIGDLSACLNDWYDMLGLEHTSLGDTLGWIIATTGQMHVQFSSKLATDGVPCLVLEYRFPPKNLDRW